MRATFSALVGAVSLILFVGVPATPGAAAGSPSGDQAKAELWTAMGRQWSDDARYTREQYVAELLGKPDAADAAEAKLMTVQAGTGKVFTGYYGKDVGGRITGLLSEDVRIGTEVVAAAKAGDKAKLAEATGRWQQSQAELAKVLATANPQHFPYDQTRGLLDQNLTLLTTAITSFAGGDYPRSIADNEAFYQDVQKLVGYLGNGIVEQFPDRFQ